MAEVFQEEMEHFPYLLIFRILLVEFPIYQSGLNLQMFSFLGYLLLYRTFLQFSMIYIEI